MLIKYEDHNFRAASLATIEQANDILAEYDGEGYALTLRQLYYQFVSRGLIPNTERSYKSLGALLRNARMAGLVSWGAIQDLERSCEIPYVQPSEIDCLEDVDQLFSADLWANQGSYVEVWVEKKALVNVIKKPCNRHQVPYMACKGYMSASEVWGAGNRFRARSQFEGKNCHLIYLGDHDPSGLDMPNDIQRRLVTFGADVKVERIALTMDQIKAYNPPPNPAKETDSRAKAYMEEHGEHSWELDALRPQVISDLITKELERLMDLDQFNDDLEAGEAKKDRLRWVSNNAQDVLDFVSDQM